MEAIISAVSRTSFGPTYANTNCSFAAAASAIVLGGAPTVLVIHHARLLTALASWAYVIVRKPAVYESLATGQSPYAALGRSWARRSTRWGTRSGSGPWNVVGVVVVVIKVMMGGTGRGDAR